MSLLRTTEEWISLNENRGQGQENSWSEEEKQFFLEFIAPQPGEVILDLGCGNGVFSQWLDQQGLRPIGLDFSPKALHRARSHQKLSIQANLTHIPFKESTFHRVIFIEVFEHLPPEQVERVLLEIHRIIKPGGSLIFHTSPNRIAEYACLLLNPLLWLLKCLGVTRRPYFRRDFAMDSIHVNKHTPHTLRKILQKGPWKGSVHPYTSFCTFPQRLVSKFPWLESPLIRYWFGLRYRGRLQKIGPF